MAELSAVVAGRFEILTEAGSGGMGTVYRARDLTTDTDVALKVLLPSGGSYERFVLESEVLCRLSHAAIVGYVAHGETDEGEPYLAMEWLEGETLRQRLSREPLTIRESVMLGRRVAGALAVAHASGVIHRDLKPSNLFLCDGQVERVKVLDFGVARLRELDRELTLTNQIIGTPGYMAPEQARGVREIDARADLFALGCVLFRCITGQAAFDGADVLSVLAKLVMHQPPPIGDLVDDVPDELEKLIICLLEKSPADRPESADLVRRELDRISVVLEDDTPRSKRPARVRDRSESTHVCVVLARPTSPDNKLSDRDYERVFGTIAEQGGRLQRLANGALLVDVQPAGTPREQAARTARCARVLSTSLTSAQVSIASGPTVRLDRDGGGAVIDAASRLLTDAVTGSVRLQPPNEGSQSAPHTLLHRHLVQALEDLGVAAEYAPTLVATAEPSQPAGEAASNAALASTLAGAARSGTRRWTWIAAGVLGLGAAALLGASLARAPDTGTAATAGIAQSSPIAPATLPSGSASAEVEARVVIKPDTAEVSVNGERRPLTNGALVLRGKPGDAFEVVARSGQTSLERRILLGADGTASVPSIELLPGGPRPTLRTRSTQPTPPTTAPPAAMPPGPVPTPSAGPARESWE